MKNSFFLVIPEQIDNPELQKSFDEAALQQWIMELPTANPGLATRLLFDLIKEFTALKMDPVDRLEALELLRPSFLLIEDYLRSRLTNVGFPKGENELKIHNVLVQIEKEFTIGYWIVARELSRKQASWFQNKSVALAIQRVVKGMSSIVITHYIMKRSIPDWVWIDLHSLYKLAVKLKKDTVKVTDETSVMNKSCSILDCYRQILLLSLADPSGLMQKEIQVVYSFIEQIIQHVSIERKPSSPQAEQFMVLVDEDQPPLCMKKESINSDSGILYLDLEKVTKVLTNKEKYINTGEARFNAIKEVKKSSAKLSAELIAYLWSRWSGKMLQGASLFADRQDRMIAVGLNATFDLQNIEELSDEGVEYLATSASDRVLSCKFEKQGVLSVGSLISFRKTSIAIHKRSMGIVSKLNITSDAQVTFEIQPLATQSHAVGFLPMDAEKDAEPRKALIYGVKSGQEEKSFLIVESYMYKDDDVLRLFMAKENFPIVLRGKKNIGLGYWQFECRQILETDKITQSSKKGFDFI